MAYDKNVTLCTNGDYWQARYYDSTGMRRTKSLGPKSRFSKRQATVLCGRLAAELAVNPGKADTGRRVSLSALVTRYLAARSDLRPQTRGLHKLTARYLAQFFGGEARVDRITRASASDWRAAMAAGKLTLHRKRKVMAEASVCLHVRNAKTIFNHAVRDDIIPFNPFDRLKGTAPEPDKDWKYVTAAELDKLIAACPDWAWKMLVALCRLAGLRRGEATNLPWTAIDWETHRLTVFAQKTGRKRIVPIEAELYKLLLQAFDHAEEREERVAPVSQHCLWRNFNTIRRHAGLEQWADAFQVMRRNCETDWAQKYPQYAVSSWIGHDIRVSARHYLQVPEELYEKVAGPKSAQTGTKTGTNQVEAKEGVIPP